MNTNLFYYSIAEIGISIVIGLLLLFITYKLMDRLVKKKFNIRIDNIAYSIFSSSVLFSVAYLISGIKAPILNSLRIISDNPEYDGSLVLDGLKYTLLFLLIIIIAIAFINFLSVKLFTLMTKSVNEFKEISENNIAVSLLTATIVISISLLVKDSLYLLLESFVPYPDVPIIF
jgi:uncharacterized membrane protein YjfL (UPF0719 family)|tara:strand:- start:527 stop:1048 length:522 start_codon:yes stop_codon:yes gene_type:complete